MARMRILITGAAGFIGSSIASALLTRGEEVIGLDNFDPFYDRALKESNVRRLEAQSLFSFIEGDILDDQALDSALGGVDRVIHLAALAGVRPSIETPARYFKVNAEGTTRLLEACVRSGISRIVVASSSSVYGSRSETPFRESDPCDHPASPYAASKKATELICSTFNELYGVALTCLRYFTVYGPRQRPEMAIHKFVRRALAGESIPMFGDGSSGRDYTFISDIVDGSIAAMDRQQDGAFKIYNLGGSSPILLRDLISTIGEATETKIDIEQLEWQAGDVPITCADVSLAQADLGYAPKVPLVEGLRQFVSWFRSRD